MRDDTIETMSNEDRDRAMYKVFINEGFSRKEIAEMIATTDRVKLDELFASLMADTERRQRDVEILTPDQMRDGIIDLNAKKIQAKSERFQKELDEEEAHWNHVRDQLIAVMAASGLSSTSLTSVTLRALLEVLLADEATTLDKAKEDIARCLNVFHIS